MFSRYVDYSSVKIDSCILALMYHSLRELLTLINFIQCEVFNSVCGLQLPLFLSFISICFLYCQVFLLSPYFEKKAQNIEVKATTWSIKFTVSIQSRLCLLEILYRRNLMILFIIFRENSYLFKRVVTGIS